MVLGPIHTKKMCLSGFGSMGLFLGFGPEPSLTLTRAVYAGYGL